MINRVNSALAGLSITALILSSVALATILEQHKVTHTVIQTKEVVFTTDSERIQLFIDELLNSKSAKCFRAILKHESHMNPKAKNPTSSAIGMGQLLDSTYRNLGLRHSTDPLAQVVASLAYIARHYGGSDSTCNAWHYWQKNSSY